MVPGALTGSLRETLAVFETTGERGEPLTTTEVADGLDVSRRSTYARLERLVDRGHLDSKKVGARGRVWWRPVATGDGEFADRSLDGDGGGYSDLVSNLPGMVYRCRNEPGWPMEFVSDACADLTGHDPGRVESGAVSWGGDVVHPGDRDHVRETVQSGLDRDGQFVVQYRVRTADGETRWVWERGRTVADPPDAPATLEGVITDITEQKETERALHRSERRFRLLVDAVEEYAIFMLDPDGRVRTWNDGAARIKGYDAADIVGEHFSAFYTDDDREAGVPERNLAAAASTGVVEDEGWRVRADGSTFWAHVTITAIRDDGELRGYAKVTRDMTDRRERERELREERDLTRQLLAAAPAGILLVDADGNVRRANERARDRFGVGDEDAVADAALYDADGNRIPHAERPYVEALETGEPVADRHCRVDLDVGERWLSIDAVPVRDGDGAVEQVVVTSQDVTRLKEQAARLERQRDDLREELDEVFERIDDGFCALDEAFRFTYVNERAEELLRADEEELLGESVWEAFPETTETPAREAFHEAMETQERTGYEVHFEPLDFWVEGRVYPSESGLSVHFGDVTERKERELELKQYETIVETVDDGVYVLDEEFRFVLVNDAYCEMTGYGREELLGADATLVVGEDVSAESAERLQEIVAGEADSASIEADVLRADGSRLPAESNFTAIPSDDGDHDWKAGVVRDLTERKERERELRRYRTIVETVDDGVYVVDDDGRFSMVNEAYAELTGYDREELVGADVSLVVDESVAETARDVKRELVSGERETAKLEAAVRTADGGTVPAEATFALFPGEDGDRERVAVVRDVTDRVERERELAASERRYRTLVDNFPNGAVVLFDEELRYLTVGGEVFDGLGFEAADLEGDRMSERLPEELRDGVEPHYRAVIDGETREFELEFDGQVRHLRVFPVHDETGDVYAGMAMSQDVTRRIEREHELERQREQLVALTNLDRVVREITDAVIEQSTREEIEETACERLADAESYLFAWVGDVDAADRTVNLRAEAGVEGYLDGVTVSVDPDDERGRGPTGRALRTGEVQTVQDVPTDPEYAPWREQVEAHGFRSSAAIPIVHGDTTYGVLNVYAARPNAFEGRERTVVGRLGEVVGHAIAAVERKRALLSDEVVELEFRSSGAFDGLDADPAGTIEFDEFVPLRDGEFLVYGTAAADARDGLRALVAAYPHWTELTWRTDGGDAGFELRLSKPPVLSTVAELGGFVAEAVVEDGGWRLRVHLSPNTDSRPIIDAMQEAYPDAKMVARRQLTRRDDRAGRVQRVLAEDLTERQRATLRAAYRSGFFEWPRGSTAEEVADSLDIASPTFSQHLRAAERKVFATLLSSPAEADDRDDRRRPG